MPEPMNAATSEVAAAVVAATPAEAAFASQARSQSRVPREDMLEIADIQGNILAGFNKNWQSFLFVKIHDRDIAKVWLRTLIPSIATVADVLPFNTMFRALRARLGTDPPGMVATWVNIAFTFSGITLLTSMQEADKFGDAAFRIGLDRRAGLLGDPSDPQSIGHPDHWVIGGTSNVPDMLLIIASDDPTHLRAAVDRIKADIQALAPRTGPGVNQEAIEIMYEQAGATRPDLPGHEHFGFKDGVSQPGIRGRISRSPQTFFTPRLIAPQDPRAALFSRPGQPLVWPGQFVLGYRRQRLDDPLTPLPALKPTPPWARNGSYLVVRRLRQDVAAFWDFAGSTAQELAQRPGFGGLTVEHVAALLVGRWPSGAPLMRVPPNDNQALGDDRFANNHFVYSAPTQPIPLIPIPDYAGDLFSQAQGDTSGMICPHFAHIRKVNPRDLPTDTGGPLDTLRRLILRRGIPFGRPLKDPAHPDPTELQEERGLMFLAYQSSLADQFEFLMNHWTNSADQPESGGPDLIIGEQQDQTGSRTRSVQLVGQNGATATIKAPIEWIIPTGGGYFFAPSISALQDVLVV